MPRGTKTPTARLKLVIRRLPPALPEETFWRVVEPFVEGKCAWRRYVKGRPGDAYGVHPQHSRAYVLMNDIESLIAFHTGFDGHIFRAKTGAEFQAVVEYAPIEKTPYKAKAKKDAREGTIDDDPDFLAFLENRGAVETKPPLEVAAPPPQPTSTPLLDALRASANKSRAKAAKKKEKAAAKKDDKDTKAEAKSDKARAAALASISEAANKRAPKAGGGAVVMVAGKGREVFVAPADTVQDGEPRDSTKSDKDKKKRKPRKKKETTEEGGEPASAVGGAGAGPGPAKEAAGKKDARAEGGVAVVDEASTDSKRRNRNRKRGGGGGGTGAGGGDSRPAPVDGGGVEETATGLSRRQKARAAREQGGGAGGTPSATRGRGRGGLLPTEARIDM
ncbi:hypothetical protein CspHIS471_0411260 [Cutaneotrichosporon sp. HIS471]|nr:hypothetical protein CspHIS471_0411260 [Cutaneotrichosporon sp. HIS471]